MPKNFAFRRYVYFTPMVVKSNVVGSYFKNKKPRGIHLVTFVRPEKYAKKDGDILMTNKSVIDSYPELLELGNIHIFERGVSHKEIGDYVNSCERARKS